MVKVEKFALEGALCRTKVLHIIQSLLSYVLLSFTKNNGDPCAGWKVQHSGWFHTKTLASFKFSVKPSEIIISQMFMKQILFAIVTNQIDIYELRFRCTKVLQCLTFLPQASIFQRNMLMYFKGFLWKLFGFIILLKKDIGMRQLADSSGSQSWLRILVTWRIKKVAWAQSLSFWFLVEPSHYKFL